MKHDLIVIGGGIIGLSCAWQLQKRYPHKNILLLEKESKLAAHQTGHNSGVIHSGVYYPPGSLKSEFCIRGRAETISFCDEFDIPYKQCGKLLVATNPSELLRMQVLYDRCVQNNLDCSLLSATELKTLEPNICGLGAILVRGSGIVDFRQVSEVLASEFVRAGGTIKLDTKVFSIKENASQITVTTSNTEHSSAFLVCCAGLQSDRLAKLQGLKVEFQIIPFKGEYYRLTEKMSDLITHLVYPIPDPALPFLGIHLTPMISGGITLGPNAVLAWKREAYARLNFNLHDAVEILGFSGFWRIASSHLGHGIRELLNSLSKTLYLKQVSKYCPQITTADLLPYPAGVRAQAVLCDGQLVHDFLFVGSNRSLHVCNAPSPAATSAFPIGEYICKRIEDRIN